MFTSLQITGRAKTNKQKTQKAQNREKWWLCSTQLKTSQMWSMGKIPMVLKTWKVCEQTWPKGTKGTMYCTTSCPMDAVPWWPFLQWVLSCFWHPGSHLGLMLLEFFWSDKLRQSYRKNTGQRKHSVDASAISKWLISCTSTGHFPLVGTEPTAYLSSS